MPLQLQKISQPCTHLIDREINPEMFKDIFSFLDSLYSPSLLATLMPLRQFSILLRAYGVWMQCYVMCIVPEFNCIFW